MSRRYEPVDPAPVASPSSRSACSSAGASATSSTSRSAAARAAPPFVFYEGPPTANGRPGSHHVLARVFKDVFPRYKTMRGHLVHRKGGWDCHGLPVELEIERELGIKSKDDIEALRHRRVQRAGAASRCSPTSTSGTG